MKSIVLAIIIILLFSCRKDKLEADKEILIGKWKWVKSEKQSYQPLAIVDTLYSIGGHSNYSIEFYKKGKIELINNGNIEKYKIKFTDFFKSVHINYYSALIDLDFDENDRIWIQVNEDTLITRCRFPFSEETYNNVLSGPYGHINYFVRDN